MLVCTPLFLLPLCSSARINIMSDLDFPFAALLSQLNSRERERGTIISQGVGFDENGGKEKISMAGKFDAKSTTLKWT